MGLPKVVNHPQSARMRSSYLLSGAAAGVAIYAGLMALTFEHDSLDGIMVFGILIPSFLVALFVGHRVWKHRWHLADCPNCRKKLELRSEAFERGRHWGYRCTDCEVFYDSGVAEKADFP